MPRIRGYIAGRLTEALALQRAMLEANPSLRGAQSAAIAQAQQVDTAAIAEDKDFGRSVDEIVVALAGGAIRGVISVFHDLDPARTSWQPHSTPPCNSSEERSRRCKRPAPIERSAGAGQSHTSARTIGSATPTSHSQTAYFPRPGRRRNGQDLWIGVPR
jgi:hypothetical protein